MRSSNIIVARVIKELHLFVDIISKWHYIASFQMDALMIVQLAFNSHWFLFLLRTALKIKNNLIGVFHLHNVFPFKLGHVFDKEFQLMIMEIKIMW